MIVTSKKYLTCGYWNLIPGCSISCANQCLMEQRKKCFNEYNNLKKENNMERDQLTNKEKFKETNINPSKMKIELLDEIIQESEHLSPQLVLEIIKKKNKIKKELNESEKMLLWI